MIQSLQFVYNGGGVRQSWIEYSIARPRRSGGPMTPRSCGVGVLDVYAALFQLVLVNQAPCVDFAVRVVPVHGFALLMAGPRSTYGTVLWAKTPVLGAADVGFGGGIGQEDDLIRPGHGFQTVAGLQQLCSVNLDGSGDVRVVHKLTKVLFCGDHFIPSILWKL